MNRTAWAVVLLILICMSACEERKMRPEDQNVLIVYFSASGKTRAAAKRVAKITGGDLYRIKPVKRYSRVDRYGHDKESRKQSRSYLEWLDSDARPAIQETLGDIAHYDTIYLGYPIWYGSAPRAINTFIDSHDLTGKTIIPFATSGKTAIKRSVDRLRTTYPELRIQEGAILNNLPVDSVRIWIESL